MFHINEEIDISTQIRHQLDPESGVLYLSIVDVIKSMGLSSDPRNYWKTLKNRLKNTQNKLVTKCNQLKMKASDGKMYLTDVTDVPTMLLIVQELGPQKVSEYRKIFKEIEQSFTAKDQFFPFEGKELSTPIDDDYEISVDAREENDFIVIQAMLAGTNPEDISVIANCENITIRGKRFSPKVAPESYLINELGWGKFSREISLPKEVDIEAIEAVFKFGLLEIKLPKVDKSRTKIIKVK